MPIKVFRGIALISSLKLCSKKRTIFRISAMLVCARKHWQAIVDRQILRVANKTWFANSTWINAIECDGSGSYKVLQTFCRPTAWYELGAQYTPGTNWSSAYSLDVLISYPVVGARTTAKELENWYSESRVLHMPTQRPK